jgi:predicted MFS family arabinose efflux permease
MIGRAARRTLGVPPYLLAALTLTLALVGDTLVYVVIPATADVYGLGAVGVSLVLSVNRFVRLAFNPLAATLLRRIGLRRGTLLGALLATASTAAYAVAPGLAALVAARVVWGAAFATLRLTALGYATVERRSAARRLGLSAGVQELAPAAALVASGALLGLLGPRSLFVAVAAVTALALVIALALPRAPQREVPPPAAMARSARTPGLRRASLAAMIVAFGVDGALVAGLVLALVARGLPPLEAAALGGVLLAARKVAQVVVSPLAGTAAARWGIRATVVIGLVATALGLALAAGGAIAVGSLLAMSAGAGTMAVIPAALAGDEPAARLRALGWLTTARDFGAATGAAAAPLALIGPGAAAAVGWTFGLTAGAVALVALGWSLSGRQEQTAQG